MLEKIGAFFQGKKTYGVIALGLVICGFQMAGYTVPPYVWEILALLGLGAVRSAISKVKG